MKIKISKSQWEGIGKKAGWMENDTNTDEFIDAKPYLMRSSKEDGESFNPNDYKKGYYLVNVEEARLIDGPFDNITDAYYKKNNNINPNAVQIAKY